MAWLRTYWRDQYMPRLRLHFGDRLDLLKCLLLVVSIALFCVLSVGLLGGG